MNKQLLHKYFAGEATPEEEKQIMDWTELSSENHKTYLEERKWWNAVLLNYHSDSGNQRKKPKKSLNIWAISAVAATIALLFVIIKPSLQKDTREAKWQTVWSPPGQRTQITLEDGTTVWLNSHSTLHYPTSFNTEKRLVKLIGEAFFDVAKKEDLPFIVETKKYNIKVLGTTFNVLAYEHQNLFETSLLSGSVEISPVNNGNAVTRLYPDEKASDLNGTLALSKIQNYDHFRWKEGLICLDDERFEDLLKKFSLYFDIEIVLQDNNLSEYRCTGKFRLNDGVDYALKVLQAEMRFDYTRDSELNKIIIR